MPILNLRHAIPIMRQLGSVWSQADWVYEQVESFQELPILIHGMPESVNELPMSI